MRKIVGLCLAPLLLSIAALMYIVDTNDPVEWHMINVNFGKNQGDAHLIRHGKKNTMIDAGYYYEAEAMVVPYLRRLGIKSIDHFFISHPHRDHYEGMEAIQNAGIRIRNVYYNMPPLDTKDCCYSRSHFLKFINAAKKRGAKLHDIKKGFKLKFASDSVMEVLHAQTTTTINGNNVDVNDMSLIMRWTVKGWRTLFTGDLNHNVGSHLANDPRMKADILKVPHHGGYGIAPESFFKTVDPHLNMIPGPTWVYEGKRGALARTFSIKNRITHCVNGTNGSVVVRFSDVIGIKSDFPSKYCPDGALSTKMEKINIMPTLFFILE